VALLAAGVCGFKATEPLHSWADALFCIIGTLTTAGIGDVVPRGNRAKFFIAVYSLVGTLAFARFIGQFALRPLEAARRRAQRAVLEKYGAVLNEQSLAEVTRGAVVKKLGLSSDDTLCTRDEFTLLNLVLQGKVSEDDILECRQAFDVLDTNRDGVLSAQDLGSRWNEPRWNEEYMRLRRERLL